MARGMRPAGRQFSMDKWRNRWLAGLVAGCVVASGMSVASPAAAAPQPAAGVVVSSPPAPTEAPDEATAVALAQKNRRPVEILAERTEIAQTYAQPDGTFRTVQASSVQRVHQGTSWVPPKPTLYDDGTVVRPTASTLDMRFSNGGDIDEPLITLVKDGRTFSLTWPGVLDPPTLKDNTATYANVLAGVDLQLTAAADSYSEVLIVRNALAAGNPRLAALRFKMATTGMTVKQDNGFITAATPAGEPVFASDGASMWESPLKTPDHTTDLAPAGVGTADDPQLQVRTERLAVQLAADSMTVVPSATMLADSTMRYPLYIDPGFNGGKEIWTPVSRKNPDTSYWTNKNYRDEMRVGQSWKSSTTDDWRTIVQFNTTPIKGATIISAAVLVNVWHTANCTASPFQLWRTNAVSKSKAVTWNNTKDKWWKRVAEVSATANKQSCPKGNDMVSFKTTAVKTEFQDAATKKNGTITLAFRAKSESDEMQWKKLVPDSTYLDVVYNRTPGKPTALGFSPCYVACAAGTAVTSTKRPSLKMTVADPDLGKLRYEYEVYDSAKKVQLTKSGTEVTGVASGSSHGWSLKKDLADGQYFWRGRGCDSYVCGAYSDWYGFKVDTANPKLPTVDADPYKPTGWNGGPGVPGVFTISPGNAADGVKTYTYALNGGTAVSITPPSTGIAKVTLTPQKDMLNTLRVEAIDLGGNRSGAMEYAFKVKPIGSSWYWSLDQGTGVTAASEPENNRPATITGTGVTWSGSGKASAGSATFAGTGELTTTAPVFNTAAAAGFTAAAWVRLPAPPASDDPGDGGTPPAGEPQPGDPGGDDPDSEGSPIGDSDDNPVLALPPAQNQTAVSEDGANASAFRLGYRADLDLDGDQKPDPAWCMTVKATDAAAAAETSACSPVDVTPGEWEHLVGIVDPLQNQIRLYVNGIPATDGTLVTAPGKATWEATGKFVIGRGGVASAPAERWVGDIDEVYALPRVWSDQEIEWHAHPPTDTALAS